jgi:dTDP-4-dehydrorhamnose reductase
MAGCDVVLHLAAMATVMACETDLAAAFAVNAGGTYRLLNVAHEVA